MQMLCCFLCLFFQPSSDVQSARSAATRIPVSKGMKPSSKAVLGVSTVARFESRAESQSMKIELRKSTVCGSASAPGGKSWGLNVLLWLWPSVNISWLNLLPNMRHRHHQYTYSFQKLLLFMQTFSFQLHIFRKHLMSFKGLVFLQFMFMHLCLHVKTAHWLTPSWWYLAVSLDLISSFIFFHSMCLFHLSLWRFPLIKALWTVCGLWIVIICDRHQNKNYLSPNPVWHCFLASFNACVCVWAKRIYEETSILTHAAKQNTSEQPWKLIFRIYMCRYCWHGLYEHNSKTKLSHLKL